MRPKFQQFSILNYKSIKNQCTFVVQSQSKMNQSKSNQSIKSLLLRSIGFLMVSGIAVAQVDKGSELFQTLKAKDSILFNIGFNKCEVERSAELMV